MNRCATIGNRGCWALAVVDSDTAPGFKALPCPMIRPYSVGRISAHDRSENHLSSYDDDLMFEREIANQDARHLESICRVPFFWLHGQLAKEDPGREHACVLVASWIGARTKPLPTVGEGNQRKYAPRQAFTLDCQRDAHGKHMATWVACSTKGSGHTDVTKPSWL